MSVELPDLELVLVVWDDAWTDPTEPVSGTEVGNAHKPLTICTLGWVLQSDDVGISLAVEYYDDTEVYRERKFIPRGMVRDVIPFKLTKPRRPKHETPDSHSVPDTGSINPGTSGY